MTNTPQFHNPKLQNAYAANDDIFVDSHQKMEQVSSDIRTLEHFLQSKNIETEFEFLLPFPNGKHYIAWLENNEVFRLFYSVSDKLDFWSCPLIETKIEIRMAVSPYLPNFLYNFAQVLKYPKLLNET